MLGFWHLTFGKNKIRGFTAPDFFTTHAITASRYHPEERTRKGGVQLIHTEEDPPTKLTRHREGSLSFFSAIQLGEDDC